MTLYLDGAPIPEGAEERAWRVVRAAFDERTPVPRRRYLWRPVVAIAVVAAIAGVLASPPGLAVLDSLREAVGVKKAQPALFSLPTPGRLLVESARGPWVVQADGSKRLLGRYRQAAWSPFGRFVVATRPNELVALDPNGNVRWTLARPAVRFPRWGGTRTDTRIAYLSRGTLRVVAGDGTGDRLLTPHVAPVPPVWAADGRFRVAFVDRAGHLTTIDTETGRVLARSRPGRLPAESATIRTRGGSSEAVLGRRVVFRGTGAFRDVVRSPDGRWLLVTWPTADQWVFVRVAGGRRIVAVSGITEQFEGSFPTISGWCCSG
jgi:hypothetical protein